MSIRFSKYLLSISVTVIIAGASCDAVAQTSTHWRKIWDAYAATGDTSIAWAGYFWSPTHGIVGIESFIGDTATTPRIFYTEDGINWIESIHPNPMYSGGQVVQFTSIQMEDEDTGWAGLQLGGYSTDVYNWMWKTTDGGKSWQGGQPFQAGQGIAYNFGFDYFDSTFDIIGNGSGNNNLFRNYGTARAWISDSVGISSGSDGNGIGFQNSLTLDGGRTWRIIPGAGLPEWGMYGSSKTQTFFTTSMWFRIRNGAYAPSTGGHNPITNYPFTSQDSGKTWIQGKYPDAPYGNPFITGDVEGGRNAVYVQTIPADSIQLVTDAPGLIRTTDNGTTWKYVGGPANENLSRFCVLPCTGSIVVAFDDKGGVWLTTDGGDGALQDHPAEPSMNSATLQLTSLLCSDTTNGLRFTDDHCDAFTLMNVSFVDSSLVKLGVLSFDTIPIVPHDYGSDMSDTIGVRWNPGLAFTEDTTAKAKIDLHYLSGTDGLEHDTIVTLTLIAKHGAIGSTLSTTSMDFGSISTCSLADSIITVTNTGCEATTVDSVKIIGSGFSLLSYDSTISSSRSGRISLRYSPNQQTQNNGDAYIFLNEQGVHVKEVVSLSGRGVQGEGILSIANTSLNAGSFSFCAGDTSVASVISNSGCDTLVISNMQFSGDGTFSLTSQPSDSLLAPNSLGMFAFNFAPRLKGIHSAQVTFHTRNLHGNDPGHDTTITINGIGLNGTTTLAVDATPRNLGQIYICQSKDTTITLYNPGCDTLTVNSDSIYNSAYSSSSTYPIVIPPGDSSVVQLSLKPSDSVLNGTITFTSNANSGSSSATVPLTANLLYPSTLRLVLAPSDSASAGQIVTAYVIIDGSIPFGQISALHFDITHNDDLLSFLKESGAGLSIEKTSPSTGIVTQSFTLTPVLGRKSISDTIGTLTFIVYLTDSSSTQLSLSNITFTTSLSNMPPDCIASIGDSGAAFAYLYRCGDKIIQDAMEGMLPSIQSIQPNPATGFIKIEGSAGPFTIFDPLGRSYEATCTANTLDISSLHPGVYFVSDGRSRAKFVKE